MTTIIEQTADELIELADLQQRAGRLQEAEAGYRAVLAKDPENPDAYNGLGLLALQIGQYDVAETLLTTAVEIAPEESTFLCNLGTALYGAAKLDAAREVFERAIEADEHCGSAYLKLGVLYKAKRKYSQAAEQLDRAVVEAPRDPEAFAHLADTLLHLGRYDSAETIARAAVNLDNRHVLGIYCLANALRQQARPQEALAWARRLVRLAPGEARHYHLLTESLLQSGLRKEAYQEARKAVALAPDEPDSLGLLAEVYGSQGEWELGLEVIEQALSKHPDDERLIGTKAGLLERCGRKEEAFALVGPMLENKSSVNPGTLNTYLTLAQRVGKQQEAAALVERTLGNGLKHPSHYGLYFTAGALYHDLGEYDRAFDFFARGNQLKPRSYDATRAEKVFGQVTTFFNTRLFNQLAGIGLSSRRPIFIVGMPRSGTSLTEQIIASHPQVFAAGELQEIQNIATSLPELLGTRDPYPDCVPGLTGTTAQQAAQRYLDFLADIQPDESLRVTDKMPQNFAHLGLIALLFPNAKIIHCRRNPLDTCLSCYFQNFAAAGLQFAYDLENLGHYYRLYHRLMAHWREVLPVPVHELHYERLTADPENEVRKLLEFCDLEWDDACLNHTQSGVKTKTASYDQVRQPIYTKSVQRWKRYEKHLKPLIDALGEEIINE